MRNDRFLACLVCLGLLTLLLPLVPTVAAETTVWGYVKDSDTDEPLFGADVTYLDLQEKKAYREVTDENGYFQISVPNNGNFDVWVNHSAYHMIYEQYRYVSDGQQDDWYLDQLLTIELDRELRKYGPNDPVHIDVYLDMPGTDQVDLKLLDPLNGEAHRQNLIFEMGGWEHEVDNHTVGLWHFNDQTGNAQDESDNKNHGDVNGATKDDGIEGEAYVFDGNADIEVLDDDSLAFDKSTSFTIEAWIRTDAYAPGGARMDIINKNVHDNQTGGYILALSERNNDWKAQFTTSDNNGNQVSLTGQTHIGDGKWHHIAGVADVHDEQARLYVDGFLDTTPTDYDFTANTDNSQPLYFGKQGDDNNRFEGLMDEVRISDVARGPDDFDIHQHVFYTIPQSNSDEGEYTLYANVTAGGDGRELSAVTTFEVRQPIQPVKARFDGQIYNRFSSGDKLQGVELLLDSLDNGGVAYNISSNALGYFYGEEIDPGNYTVTLSMDGYWDRQATIYLEGDQKFSRDFWMIPREDYKGLLWGFVEDTSGQRLGNAAVLIEDTVRDVTHRDSAAWQDGYYARQVNPGSYDLIATAYGYSHANSGTLTVTDGEPTRYDFILDTEVSSTNTFLEGQVKDNGGSAILGVEVTVRETDGARGAEDNKGRTFSDSNGWWRVGLDDGGDYLVGYTIEDYGYFENSQSVTKGQDNDLGQVVLVRKPKAFIDSIDTGYSGFAVKGDDVDFHGSANGGSGTYQRSEWRYIGPEGGDHEILGLGATMTKSLPPSLVSGTYTIQFLVQDDEGVWSDPDQQQLELVGKPQVEIVQVDDNPNPDYYSVSQFEANVVANDFDVVNYEWELHKDSIDGEPLRYGDQSNFEINWREDGEFSPGDHIIRMRASDTGGLFSVWKTRHVTLHDNNGEYGPTIESLHYDYDRNDELHLSGNTKGAQTDGFKWILNGEEIGWDQNLDVNLSDLGLEDGEHSLVFAYRDPTIGDSGEWVYSEPKTFYYHKDDFDPGPIFAALFILFVLVMVVRRRRKRKRAKKARKAAARGPAIPRSPAYSEPGSLYDNGASPYAPDKSSPVTRSRPMDPSHTGPQRIALKPEGEVVFGAALPAAKKTEVKATKEPEGKIEIKSAVNYEKANIIFKLKVENNTSKPIAEVRVRPFAPSNLFKADKEERTIGLIQPKQAQTATFKLRPRGECGNVTLQAKVTFYDTGTNKYAELDAKPRETAIVCPMLKYEDIDEHEWRKRVSKMLRVEETTDKIPMDGESLYSMVTDVFQDQNLTSISMNVDRGRVFRGRAMFWAKGAVAAKGLGYAAQIEVIGGELRSKLILKAYANGQDSLVGFYHCLLDEIEKRTSVRDYLDTGVTVQHVYGDMVKGGKVDIKDSVLQRSKITTDAGSTPAKPGKPAKPGQPADAPDATGKIMDVKGDRVEGGKVEIKDSVVTRSNVGALGEERIPPTGDGSSLDQEMDRLRSFVKDKDDDKDKKKDKK